MNFIFEPFNGDFVSLLITVLVFTWVGRRAIGSQESLRLWGWRFAFLAFVAYVATAASTEGLDDPTILGAAAFRGLLAGGLVLGVSWIALAICHFVFRTLFGTASKPFRRLETRRERKRREREQRRADEEHRWQEQERAERDREQQQRKLERERQQKEDQKRREDARFACEWLYDRHRVQVVDKFPPARLDEYFQRYMGDDHPAEQVEARAEQLRTMLEELLAAAENGNGKQRRFDSITTLNEDFDRQREDIARSTMDGERISNLIAYLERERERAIREFNQR